MTCADNMAAEACAAWSAGLPTPNGAAMAAAIPMDWGVASGGTGWTLATGARSRLSGVAGVDPNFVGIASPGGA